MKAFHLMMVVTIMSPTESKKDHKMLGKQEHLFVVKKIKKTLLISATPQTKLLLEPFFQALNNIKPPVSLLATKSKQFSLESELLGTLVNAPDPKHILRLLDRRLSTPKKPIPEELLALDNYEQLEEQLMNCEFSHDAVKGLFLYPDPIKILRNKLSPSVHLEVFEQAYPKEYKLLDIWYRFLIYRVRDAIQMYQNFRSLKFAESLRDRPGGSLKVLDNGAGHSLVLMALKLYFQEVEIEYYAVDVNEQVSSEHQIMLEEYGCAKFYQINCAKLLDVFSPHEFDLVICQRPTHLSEGHQEYWKEFFGEVFPRIIKEGGHAYFAVVFANEWKALKEMKVAGQINFFEKRSHGELINQGAKNQTHPEVTVVNAVYTSTHSFNLQKDFPKLFGQNNGEEEKQNAANVACPRPATVAKTPVTRRFLNQNSHNNPEEKAKHLQVVAEAERLYLLVQDGDEAAQAQWDKDMLYHLACCYAKGSAVIPKNEEQAVRFYKLAAEKGHIKAQISLGNCFYVGRGVLQNDERAMSCYKLAADQGDPTGQFNLGRCCYNGIGVPKNLEEGIRLYRLSAIQGNENAKRAIKKIEDSQATAVVIPI